MSLPLITCKLKTTEPVDFHTAFSFFISNKLNLDSNKYENQIQTLTSFRQDFLGAGLDLAGRDIVYRYYGQLELLDLRFSFTDNNLDFIWFDSFTNEHVAQHSFAFEKACVIFNLAAIISGIASASNKYDQSGIKQAFNYFQCAAGLYSYINENFLHAPSLDLSKECCKCLSELMLAQAQECFIIKVLMEKKKGNVVSKLCNQLGFMYLKLTQVHFRS